MYEALYLYCRPPCPAGQCSGDVSVWKRTGPVRHRWPRGIQGWRRHGKRWVDPYTAGSTECGPSHGAR